jgi:hypothetical protein
MANLVEFLIKLTDMASGPMQKFAAGAETGLSRVTKGVAQVETGLMVISQKATQANTSLVRMCNQVQLNIDDSQLTEATINIDKFQRKLRDIGGGGGAGGGGIGGPGGSGGSGGGRGLGAGIFGGIGRQLRMGLMLAGIGGAGYLAKDIMQAGIGRQMDLTAMETLVGKKPGDKLNSQLIDFAKRSIYGNEVFNEGKLMAGSGIKANNIMPVLTMIGDIAMGDKERMKSLALAFSEASTRGSLNGMNERMFLQGGLFNPIEQLHKMTGRSLPDLKKDMEKGKISIDMLVQAFQYATGPMGRWHDMMKKMQETPAGKWTAFTGTLRTLAGTIGLALLPALGHLTDFLTLLINNGPALEGVAVGIGAMTAAWMLYTAWAERAAIWSGIVEAAAYWPLLVVGAIAGGITYLCAMNDKLAESNQKTWMGKVFNGELIRRFFETIAYWAQYAWFTVEQIGEGIAKIAVGLVQIAKGNYGAGAAIMSAETSGGFKKRKLALDWEWHTAMDYNGLDDNGKPKPKGKSPLDILGGKYQSDGPGAGGSIAGDTTNSITGGGVRNITINVMKPFTDKVEIHSVNLKEGVQEIEEIFRDMFLRITNSAATAMS